MASHPPSPPDDDVGTDKKMSVPVTKEGAGETMATKVDDGDVASVRKGEDLLALQDLDPALNAKMHLVNNVSATPNLYANISMHTD